MAISTISLQHQVDRMNFAKDKLYHPSYLQMDYHTNISAPPISPLVLLAATCSSIGKSENELQEEYRNIYRLSSLSNSISQKLNCNLASLNNSYESSLKPKMKKKMSVAFKPYNNNHSPYEPCSLLNKQFKSCNTISEATKNESFPQPYFSTNISSLSSTTTHITTADKNIFENQHNWPGNSFHFLNNDFMKNFNHTNNLPHSNRLYSVRPHSDPLPLTKQKPESCHCSICIQKVRDINKFEMASVCRDPNCVSCFYPNKTSPLKSKCMITSETTSDKTSGFPYAIDKQYTCNWVSESKQCGSCFSTSEDLFKHLKTHTSLQQRFAKDINIQYRTPDCRNSSCMCQQKTLTPMRENPYTGNVNNIYPGHTAFNRYDEKLLSSNGLSAFKPLYVSRR